MDAVSEVSHYRKGQYPGRRDEEMVHAVVMSSTPKRRAQRAAPHSPWEHVAIPMWTEANRGVPTYNMAEGEVMQNVLTEAEQKMIAKSRAKKSQAAAKRVEQAALTGQRADYPSLSHAWSNEVAFNMVASVRSRMVTFMWKKLTWQLRVKQALAETYPQARWKKNQRWLAGLLGKEVAALWGHLGAMRQQLHAPIGVALM